MLARLLAVALLAGGCYSPAANPGAPCSTEGACPTGQECRSGWCFAIGAPGDADAVDQAVAIDARPDGTPYVPWGTPTHLTSLDTASPGEDDPSVTADKLTAVFTVDTATNDSDIYIATRSALTNTFTPSPLTAVNATGFNESSPELSADGKTLYFVSNRSGSWEVYISKYTTSWSAPTIATDLSSASTDGDLAISPDGLTAVVCRDGTPNRFYLYTRATTADAFAGATVHTELNVMDDIASPTITNGGNIIYLHAGAPRDLYRAERMANGTYTTPVPVTELNVAASRDAAPFVSQTDDYMIFDRGSGIYESTRTLP